MCVCMCVRCTCGRVKPQFLIQFLQFSYICLCHPPKIWAAYPQLSQAGICIHSSSPDPPVKGYHSSVGRRCWGLDVPDWSSGHPGQMGWPATVENAHEMILMKSHGIGHYVLCLKCLDMHCACSETRCGATNSLFAANWHSLNLRDSLTLPRIHYLHTYAAMVQSHYTII